MHFYNIIRKCEKTIGNKERKGSGEGKEGRGARVTKKYAYHDIPLQGFGVVLGVGTEVGQGEDVRVAEVRVV